MKDTHKVDIIFKAGLELITKEGIAGLTMSKLAKKAGLATGTLYIYFKSKEELLNQLYTKLNKESVERFIAGYDPSDPFIKGLKKVWLNYLIEHYSESVFLEQYYRSPYMTREEKKMAEAMKLPVHKIIRQGKELGLVRDNADDEILFLAMLGFIRELADEHVTGVYILNQERIDQAFQISWASIKK